MEQVKCSQKSYGALWLKTPNLFHNSLVSLILKLPQFCTVKWEMTPLMENDLDFVRTAGSIAPDTDTDLSCIVFWNE